MSSTSRSDHRPPPRFLSNRDRFHAAAALGRHRARTIPPPNPTTTSDASTVQPSRPQPPRPTAAPKRKRWAPHPSPQKRPRAVPRQIPHARPPPPHNRRRPAPRPAPHPDRSDAPHPASPFSCGPARAQAGTKATPPPRARARATPAGRGGRTEAVRTHARASQPPAAKRPPPEGAHQKPQANKSGGPQPAGETPGGAPVTKNPRRPKGTPPPAKTARDTRNGSTPRRRPKDRKKGHQSKRAAAAHTGPAGEARRVTTTQRTQESALGRREMKNKQPATGRNAGMPRRTEIPPHSRRLRVEEKRSCLKKGAPSAQSGADEKQGWGHGCTGRRARSRAKRPQSGKKGSRR